MRRNYHLSAMAVQYGARPEFWRCCDNASYDATHDGQPACACHASANKFCGSRASRYDAATNALLMGKPCLVPLQGQAMPAHGVPFPVQPRHVQPTAAPPAPTPPVPEPVAPPNLPTPLWRADSSGTAPSASNAAEPVDTKPKEKPDKSWEKAYQGQRSWGQSSPYARCNVRRKV